MRNLIFIPLFLIVVACSAQTRINGARIIDGTVAPEKFTADALRPTTAVLPGPELTFDEPHKVYTHTMSADIDMLLAESGNVAHSRIDLIVTGDGSHVMTFPATWVMRGDAYNSNFIQEIRLNYNGVVVVGEIITLSAVDALTTALTSAVITRESPTELVLTFNEAVTFSSMGWSVSASAAGVTIGQVSGSGTANIVLTLSRAILHTETVTISYGTDNGETTDLAGFELAAITDFNVTEPEAPDPVTQDCDITVCASGCDYTTITAANAAANDGDIICIGSGTYRETITVADNNVTFTNITGETATISGFNEVGTTGWTVHSGNIYKKTITLPVNGFNTTTSFATLPPGNTTIFANQIVRNGEMMVEARWPNISNTSGQPPAFVDLMKWENYRQLSFDGGFGLNSLTDATLPLSTGLTGATLISNGWFPTESKTVTQTGSTTLTYGNIWNDGDGKWARKAYYLTGKLALLDKENEWHYESGTLYFWQPGGGSPSGTIEYKARNTGFDIRGRAGIKIIGLDFTGCDPVLGDASSTNALVEKTTAKYNNHHVRFDVSSISGGGVWNGGIVVGMQRLFGSKLLGSGSVFKDNVWERGAATALWLGANTRAENNKIQYFGQAGGSGAGISFWDRDDNITVTRNTIAYIGRSCIDFGYIKGGDHLNVEISYNHMHNYGMLSGDGGGSYAAGETNTTGLNYHHNWIHDNKARTIAQQGGVNCGIYFDQASGGGSIHHNVLWGNPSVDLYHEVINGERSTNTLFNIYNNTFAGTYLVEGNESSYRTYITSPQDVQRNNIYRRDMVVGWPQAEIKGNTLFSLGKNTNPLFVGSGTDGLFYRIQSGSPAVNAGTTIAGITDGSVGVPDIGAYEYGGDEWVPGYTEPTSDGSVNDTEFTFSLGWTRFTNFKTGFKDNDVHVTTTQGSTAEYAFHGTQVEIVAEKCNNSAVMRVEVLDDEDQVVDTEDVDLYVAAPGGSTEVCPTGASSREVVFTSETLAEGDYTVRVTLQTQNTGVTPARNAIVFDGAVVTP